MMDEIRLLLVDDHDVVRTGLQMLLESVPEMVIVGQASTGMQALEIVNLVHPDVVVMDITLPDISGIEATRRIKEVCPDVAVLALTMHEDDQYFFEMLAAGASGYVPKRAAPNDLISAIHAVQGGGMFLFPSLARVLVQDYLGREATRRALFHFTLAGQIPANATIVSAVLSLYLEGGSGENLSEGRVHPGVSL